MTHYGILEKAAKELERLSKECSGLTATACFQVRVHLLLTIEKLKAYEGKTTDSSSPGA